MLRESFESSSCLLYGVTPAGLLFCISSVLELKLMNCIGGCDHPCGKCSWHASDAGTMQEDAVRDGVDWEGEKTW
jgi:hypothetical protein